MKFLAILKDSLREAVDYKIFYVMIGLSLLLAVLALSLSFTPVPGGERVVREFALLPLNADAPDLDHAQAVSMLFQARPVRFTAKSVEPLAGEPDAPSSRFRVVLEAEFATADAANKAEADPAQVEAFVRQRFGHIAGGAMLEAEDVHIKGWKGLKIAVLGRNLGGRQATIELQTRPTAATGRFWPHQPAIFFGALPLMPQAAGGVALFQVIDVIEGGLIGRFGSIVAVLIGVIITAFFIPNMLRKGTVDLLVVKPIRRSRLLLYKYVGGLTFIFLNAAVAVGAVWLALGVRTGVWPVSFLASVLVLTFFFAILYSVSTFFGVLTRSPVAAILLTVAAWFILFIVGVGHNVIETFRALDRTARALHDKLGDEGLQALQAVGEVAGEGRRPGQRRVTFEDMRFEENWFTRTVSVLHAVLPRTNDLDQLLERRLRHDLAFGTPSPPPRADKPPPELPGGIPLPQLQVKPPPPAETFGVSAAFIAVFLALACWRFATKDY
jgi:ABC-type transport system involved in multi-copper enzyme maturation permease subunit